MGMKTIQPIINSQQPELRAQEKTKRAPIHKALIMILSHVIINIISLIMQNGQLPYQVSREKKKKRRKKEPPFISKPNDPIGNYKPYTQTNRLVWWWK